MYIDSLRSSIPAMMHDLPGKEQVQYFRGMISDEEKQELYTDGFAEGVKQGRAEGLSAAAKILVEKGFSEEEARRMLDLD